MSQNPRYSRQSRLPEIGESGQDKLARARVLCIGAGGLGCPALLYLTAAGVGTHETGVLGIVDFDRVEVSNLQRQILFTDTQQGRAKVEAARERLNALNPDVNIRIDEEKLTAQNAPEIMSGYDIIIDGTDNFPAKFLINDAGVRLGKPVIYGSILGFEGQIAVFDSTRGPCYRCLYPQPPAGYVPNCAEAGIIGAVAGMIGTAQAMEAIKLITAHKTFSPLIGRLLLVDARTAQSRILDLPKDPACPVCSRQPEEIELADKEPLCDVITAIPEINAREAAALEDALFIDVREEEEWQEGHIKDAIHMPLSDLLAGKTLEKPAGKTCILYCHLGMRSQQAGDFLKRQGMENLLSLQGGFESWLISTQEEPQSRQRHFK